MRRRRRGQFSRRHGLPTARTIAYEAAQAARERRAAEQTAGVAPVAVRISSTSLFLSWTELYAIDDILLSELVTLNAQCANANSRTGTREERREVIERRSHVRSIEKHVSTALYGSSKRFPDKFSVPVTVVRADGTHEVRFDLAFRELVLLDEIIDRHADEREVVESIATKIHTRLMQIAEDGLAREDAEREGDSA